LALELKQRQAADAWVDTKAENVVVDCCLFLLFLSPEVKISFYTQLEILAAVKKTTRSVWSFALAQC
jgi:hypothetical protein